MVDTDDLARLTAALQTHAHHRQPALAATPTVRETNLLRAVSLALLAGPTELGVVLAPSPLQDETYATLQDVGADDIPEARTCRLWLSCTTGEGDADAASEFASLASELLWEPVLALAYRALAYYGRRQVLGNLLPKDGPLLMVQAEAWLEAAAADNPHWLGRITPAPEGILPPTVCEQWATLLRSETALAYHDNADAIEKDLSALAALAADAPPGTYAEVEAGRIAGRAAAALIRARLAQGRGDDGALAGPALRFLPKWEQAYLQALTCWQHDDHAGAIINLKGALVANPHQTPIQLALASLLAHPSPQAALDVLEHPEPTREMIAVRAALLARLGRYDEANYALAGSEGVGGEPTRYSWARGRAQARQREYALRTALAEHHGHWEAAGKAWRAAQAEPPQKTLQEARQVFSAHLELRTLSIGQAWRRNIVAQRLERGRHQLSSIPLAGDALFFRAVAQTELLPERAAKDFETVLHRPAWVKAERRVGGGRLIFAGDALLRLGQIREAARAYEMVGSLPEAKERLAVAAVCAEILGQAEPQAITRAAEQVAALAPASPWPPLLAALGRLIVGEAGEALTHLRAAEERGAPERACRCLRAVCAAASSGAAALTDDDLTALHLPVEVEAIVRLLCGPGEASTRLDGFVRTLGAGWISCCPIDPAIAARHLLATWCEAGQWEQALTLADELTHSGRPWAQELWTLTHVRHALERASRGELREAERELQALETPPQSGSR